MLYDTQACRWKIDRIEYPEPAGSVRGGVHAQNDWLLALAMVLFAGLALLAASQSAQSAPSAMPVSQ